jgi:hypothetical protein
MSPEFHETRQLRPLPLDDPLAAVNMLRAAMRGSLPAVQGVLESQSGISTPFTRLMKDLNYRTGSGNGVDRRLLANNVITAVDAYTSKSNTESQELSREYLHTLGKVMLQDATDFRNKQIRSPERATLYHPYSVYSTLMMEYLDNPYIDSEELRYVLGYNPHHPRKSITHYLRRIERCRASIPELSQESVWETFGLEARYICLTETRDIQTRVRFALRRHLHAKDKQAKKQAAEAKIAAERRTAGFLEPLKEWRGLGNMRYAADHLTRLREARHRGIVPGPAVPPKNNVDVFCSEIPRAVACDTGHYGEILTMDIPGAATYILGITASYNAAASKKHRPTPATLAPQVRIAIAYLKDVAIMQRLDQQDPYETAKWYSPYELAHILAERYGSPPTNPLYPLAKIDRSWAHHDPDDILPPENQVQPILQKKA